MASAHNRHSGSDLCSVDVLHLLLLFHAAVRWTLNLLPIAAPLPATQDFIQDGVTIHGTRYFSLTYQVKTTNLNCGWKEGAPFCWMAEAWDDVPAFAPAYRSYDPAIIGCQDAQPPSERFGTFSLICKTLPEVLALRFETLACASGSLPSLALLASNANYL